MGNDERALVRKIANAGFGNRPKELFYVEWASKHTGKHTIRYRGFIVLKVRVSSSEPCDVNNAIAKLKLRIAAVDKALEEKISLIK